MSYSPGPALDIAIPFEYYNTICLFTSSMLILWLLLCTMKFLDIIKLRKGITQGKVVQVRGLGSYLSFFEEAMPQHATTAAVRTATAASYLSRFAAHTATSPETLRRTVLRSRQAAHCLTSATTVL